MPVIFHILDALSRDQYTEVTRETEDEQEVLLTWDDDTDPDVSLGKPNTNKTQCMMTIHLFGMTADGESLRCDVEGFRPFLYVKVPPTLDINQFRELLGREAPASMSVERVKRKELYGFTADEEFTFFKLSVANMKDFRAVKNLLLNDHQEPVFTISKKSAPLPVYESGLDPLLRFFHVRDVAPCGWVSVDASNDGFDDETGIRVISCSWEDVSPELKPPKPAAPFKTLFWQSLIGAAAILLSRLAVCSRIPMVKFKRLSLSLIPAMISLVQRSSTFPRRRKCYLAGLSG